jgi:hypothetical protein
MRKEILPFRDAHSSVLSRLLDAASEVMIMVVSDLILILIPLAPAVAFMLWVIYALEKQIRRDRRRDAIARPKG